MPSSNASLLKKIIMPESVAVIGASDRAGSVGRTVLKNLIDNPFGGVVYPVNTQRKSVRGIQAVKSVLDIKDTPDCAVICTPAKLAPALVEECGQAGIQGIIIISAGFRELGKPGIELEDKIKESLNKYTMRIVGPNCLGVMNPQTGFNATFGGVMGLPGSIGFVSQSGALCTAMLDWSVGAGVGFSVFISSGAMLDVNWGDLLGYLGDDEKTKSILIYMESIGNAGAFLSTASKITPKKPIYVIKAGRSAEAAKAAASHTGSLTGSDDVLDAAFRRAGVIRVDTISDLFNLAMVLDSQPLPKGPNLTIVTNAGGPGVLATDSLVMGGGKLTELSSAAYKAYNDFLPPHWSRNNPVDILGDATPDAYGKALKIAADDKNSDGMLVILTPQDMTDPTETARQLAPYAKTEGKPIFSSWMGGSVCAEGRKILNAANIPTFAYPDVAARLFNYMWKYNIAASNAVAASAPAKTKIPADAKKTVDGIFAKALKSGRTLLTEFESKQVLTAYGIKTVETVPAATPDAAAAAAEKLGFPVVIKLNSETITHKTDVGGVVLNLKTAADVKAAFETMKSKVVSAFSEKDFLGVTVQKMANLSGAYEIILGCSIDAQLGPVLLFGTGGVMVEVFKDSALAIPPLNEWSAQELMKQTKIFKALKGVRGRKSVNVDALCSQLVCFSRLISDNPRIVEMDINPMIVGEGDNILALDARVVLHDPAKLDADLLKSAL